MNSRIPVDELVNEHCEERNGAKDPGWNIAQVNGFHIFHDTHVMFSESIGGDEIKTEDHEHGEKVGQGDVVGVEGIARGLHHPNYVANARELWVRGHVQQERNHQ